MSDIEWKETYEDATREAGRRRLPLVVDFWSDGCLGCVCMERETYADASVVDFINRHAVPYKVDTQNAAAVRQVVGRHKVLWTPTIRVSDGAGRESRRVVGFLSPRRFIAEVTLGAGLVSLMHGRLESARESFECVIEGAGKGSDLGAEALYWVGVTDFRTQGTKAAIRPAWDAIGRDYAASSWWERADVFPAADAAAVESSPLSGGSQS